MAAFQSALGLEIHTDQTRKLGSHPSPRIQLKLSLPLPSPIVVSEGGRMHTSVLQPQGEGREGGKGSMDAIRPILYPLAPENPLVCSCVTPVWEAGVTLYILGCRIRGRPGWAA